MHKHITLYPMGTSLSLVYAGDVGVAVALSLEAEAAKGRVYNISGHDMSLWDFKNMWRDFGGSRLQLGQLPFRIDVRTGRLSRPRSTSMVEDAWKPSRSRRAWGLWSVTWCRLPARGTRRSSADVRNVPGGSHRLRYLLPNEASARGHCGWVC